jgi:FtsP/CotA-like multicopper oxidase with cupredoxin domain
MFLLNGHQFHDPPTETPFVDSTEVWNIINVTPFTHPIHLHLVQFRVLQRRPFNATSFVSGQQPQYTGDARFVSCARSVCVADHRDLRLFACNMRAQAAGSE